MTDELEGAVNDVYDDVIRSEWERAKTLIENLAAGYGTTPQGLARAYQEGQVEVKRWEAQHPGLKWGAHCDCFCRRMFHDPETCSTDAEQLHTTVFANGDMVDIPMCDPCAAATDEHVRMRQANS